MTPKLGAKSVEPMEISGMPGIAPSRQRSAPGCISADLMPALEQAISERVAYLSVGPQNEQPRARGQRLGRLAETQGYHASVLKGR